MSSSLAIKLRREIGGSVGFRISVRLFPKTFLMRPLWAMHPSHAADLMSSRHFRFSSCGMRSLRLPTPLSTQAHFRRRQFAMRCTLRYPLSTVWISLLRGIALTLPTPK